MPSPAKGLLGVVAVLMTLSGTSSASAAEPEAHELEQTPRLAYMDSLLRHYETESSRYRTLNAALGVAKGALSIPVGSFVLSRDLSLPGVVLIANGGLALGAGLLDLLVYKEPFEELREHFLARARSGAPVGETLDATEREWLAKARSVHSARIRAGVVAMGAGVVLLGFGAVLGLGGVDAPSASTSAPDRASFASLLMGFGGINASTGLRALLVEDPIESGWQSYSRARQIWGQARFNVVAFRGGAYLGLSSTF